MSPRHHPQMELSFPEWQDSKIHRLICAYCMLLLFIKFRSIPHFNRSMSQSNLKPFASNRHSQKPHWYLNLFAKKPQSWVRNPSLCSKSHFTAKKKKHNTWPILYQLWFQLQGTLPRFSGNHNMNVPNVPRSFFKTSFNLVTSWDSSCTFFRDSSKFLAFVIASRQQALVAQHLTLNESASEPGPFPAAT